MNVSFWLEDKKYSLNIVKQEKNEFQVFLGKTLHHVSCEFLENNEVLLSIDGKIHSVVFHSNKTSHSVYINGKSFTVEKKSAHQIPGDRHGEQKKRDVKTSMPGKIIKVLVQEGDKVQEGQAVLILEAMKMQNEIKSPQSGRIIRMDLQEGESVETGALLFSVE
jgi:biotin carboxyl carrier protein